MNPFFSIILLIYTNYLVYHFSGIFLGLVSSLIVIYKILYIFGKTRTPTLFLGSFQQGLSYTKDYFGSYTQHQGAFEEARKLIKKFNLKDFVLIALYYDKPGSMDDNKLRSSIGIYKRSRWSPEKMSEEFEKYCEQNGYNKSELPDTSSLCCIWDYFNYNTMMIGIQKFYKLLDLKIRDDNFKKTFNIDENKTKISIEVYENIDSNISFYVPLINTENFMVFKKNK